MANALINALSETWNAGGTTFTAIKMDVTDTASAAGSLLLDLLVGASSKFKVSKGGAVTATGAYTGTVATLAAGTITDTAPAITATQTWNDAADTFKGISLAITDTASAAASKLIDLLVGGTTQFNVTKAGLVTATGNFVTASAGSFVFGARGSIAATADGIFQVADTAGTAFSRLMFGGATSSFPSLKRATTTLICRLADDSADAGFLCGALTASGAFTGTVSTLAAGTITVSTPAVTATQTWNDAGVTFKGISLAVTSTASAAGSLLIDLLVGGTSQFSVTKAGALSQIGAMQALSGTAVPAGGTAGAGYKFSSTANLGLFFGSGVPTLAAAQGALYIRTDGSSTSTRLYVNTDGGTTWTTFTSAA